MQPLHYNLRSSAAKDNSITHAAAAPSNLDAAIPLRSATRDSRNAKNYAHRNNHLLQNTEEEPKATAAATAAHRRYLSSSAAATLHGKTQCFVLRPPPHNIAHATVMQPFHCDLQPEIQETQKTTHTGTTTCCKTQRRNQKDRSRNRRTQEVPFIVGCSHFTRKNTMFRALASSPQHSPCNSHAAIPLRSATRDSRDA